MTLISPLNITVKSPEMKNLFSNKLEIETLASNFRWPEGPLWVEAEERLIFSDVSGNTMYSWNRKDGVTVFRKPSGYANGNALDKQNRLISCEHGNRRVSITDENNIVTPLVTHFEGKKLNSPNDVVLRSDGMIYFTDPPDGLTENWGVIGQKELEFQGVYRISTKGELILEVEDFQTPNGLAFSPDEKYIYVDDTDKMHVRRFDVETDGSINSSSSHIFAVLDPSLGPGWPDGLKIDANGNLYVTGPAGIWIFDKNGKQLGIIHTPITATNMNWGGDDRTELFITAAEEDFSSSAVYRIQMEVSGFC